MEIGVDVDDGIIACLDALGRVLHAVLADDGGVGGGIVGREIAHVGSELGAEHFCYAEEEVNVGIAGESGNRGNVVVGGGLVGEFVLPVEDAPVEVLTEGGCQEADVLIALRGADGEKAVSGGVSIG